MSQFLFLASFTHLAYIFYSSAEAVGSVCVCVGRTKEYQGFTGIRV